MIETSHTRDGDINFDGRIDLEDFGQFKANFPGIFAAADGIPEPGTICLGALAFAWFTFASRRGLHRTQVRTRTRAASSRWAKLANRGSRFTIALAMLLTACASETLAQFPPPNVLYYSFEGTDTSAPVADLSGNGNTGVIVGPAEYSAQGEGFRGRAMNLGDFDNGAYIRVGTGAEGQAWHEGAFDSITANDAFTIAFWIYGGGAVNQWTFYAGPGRQIGSHAPWSNGHIYLDVNGCCGADQRINKQMPAGTFDGDVGGWTHLAYTKDGPNTAIYINGGGRYD